MKIIELLNKIANGEEVPDKIKWGVHEFEWFVYEYKADEFQEPTLLDYLSQCPQMLNDEIITFYKIEEPQEHKIPKNRNRGENKMELRVNDYVRYRCAYDNTIKIKKINAIVPPDNLIEENYYKFDDYEGTIEKCIIKSSPNIIDLIEVGDYVNGCMVINKKDDTILIQLIIPFNLKEKDIKSIVTKECFENMEYKMEE